MIRVYFTNGTSVTYNDVNRIQYHGQWAELLLEKVKGGRTMLYVHATVPAAAVLRAEFVYPCRTTSPELERLQEQRDHAQRLLSQARSRESKRNYKARHK